MSFWGWTGAAFSFGAVTPVTVWSRWVKREGVRFAKSWNWSRYPVVNTTRECRRRLRQRKS